MTHILISDAMKYMFFASFLLLGLKLIGFIDVSWLWVAAPLIFGSVFRVLFIYFVYWLAKRS